jgi:hypothetical protein
MYISLPLYTLTISLMADELQNAILAIINYTNNQHIRNLWFRYIDYFNINGIYDNYYILINHTIFIIIVIYLLYILIYLRNTYNPYNALRIF